MNDLCTVYDSQSQNSSSVSIVFFVADLELMFFLHVDFEQHEQMYKQGNCRGHLNIPRSPKISPWSFAESIFCHGQKMGLGISTQT